MAEQTTDPFAAAPDPKTAPAPPPAAEAPTVLTPYLILKHTIDNGWETVQEKTARNATAAIRAVVEKLTEADQAGTYVACPMKSWNPVKVAPKTVTTLEMESA